MKITRKMLVVGGAIGAGIGALLIFTRKAEASGLAGLPNVPSAGAGSRSATHGVPSGTARDAAALNRHDNLVMNKQFGPADSILFVDDEPVTADWTKGTIFDPDVYMKPTNVSPLL